MTTSGWLDSLRSLGNGALDLLYPPRCQACKAFDREPLCAKCREAVIPILPPLCDPCGQPLAPLAPAGTRCADCRRDRFHFEACRSAARFDGPLREALHAFKYQGRTQLAAPLARLLLDCLADESLWRPSEGSWGDAAFEVVVPVPLHRRRLRQRGYNQSELLAREVARQRQLPCDTKSFLRIKETADQIGLSARQREDNVRGAFAVTGEALRGKCVLLIDDTYTTGATMSECARALLRGNATRVFGLTVARAVY